MSGIVLGTEYTVKETDKNPCAYTAYFLVSAMERNTIFNRVNK